LFMSQDYRKKYCECLPSIAKGRQRLHTRLGPKDAELLDSTDL